MGELIIGIIVDILRHIAVEFHQCSGVSRVPAPARLFGILNSAKFVVLDPEIRLQDLNAAKSLNISISPLGIERFALAACATEPDPRGERGTRRNRTGPQKFPPISSIHLGRVGFPVTFLLRWSLVLRVARANGWTR